MLGMVLLRCRSAADGDACLWIDAQRLLPETKRVAQNGVDVQSDGVLRLLSCVVRLPHTKHQGQAEPGSDHTRVARSISAGGLEASSSIAWTDRHLSKPAQTRRACGCTGRLMSSLDRHALLALATVAGE